MTMPEKEPNRINVEDYLEAHLTSGRLPADGMIDLRRDMRQGEVYPVLEQIAGGLSAMIEASTILIYMVTPNQDYFLPLLIHNPSHLADEKLFYSEALHPSTDLLAYALLTHRESILSNQTSQDARISPSILQRLRINRALALPLRSGNDLLGAVILCRDEGSALFTNEHAQQSLAIVNAMGLALDNLRLYEETQNRLLESQSLHKIAISLLQKMDLDEVLELVCVEARRLTGAAGSSVALMEEGQWLRVEYNSGESMHARGRFPVSDSMLGMAVRRGGPVCINRRKPPLEGGATGTPVSVLMIPLKVKEETIGVLDVINKVHGFTLDDVRLIQIYADQASIAIEHARLNRQVESMAVVEERQRLGRELHDSVNQSLYAISLYSRAALRQLEVGNYAAVQTHLENLSASTKDALGEMRRLIFDLRPPILEQEGLASALEARLKSVEERVGIETGIKVRLDGRLPETVENELYRIAQEALNNVIKHAEATQVTIYLVQSGHVLLFKVQDNGKGFDQHTVQSGMGFKTIQERAELIRGRCSIISQPGLGTTVTVEVNI